MKRNQLIILVIVVILVIASLVAFLLTREKGVEEPTPITETENPFVGKPLPPDKEAIKQELIANVKDGGTIIETPEFNIHYFPPDIFQAEIKTTNIVDSKEKAIAWFKGKGLGEEDICKLPLTFYLSPEVAQKLQGSGVIFNTLPDFCR